MKNFWQYRPSRCDLVGFKVGSRHEKKMDRHRANIRRYAGMRGDTDSRRTETWNAKGSLRSKKENLRRLYIKNIKLAPDVICGNARYKDLIKKAQRITFEIISHPPSLLPDPLPLLLFRRISRRSRHALHRPFPLRIKREIR